MQLSQRLRSVGVNSELPTEHQARLVQWTWHPRRHSWHPRWHPRRHSWHSRMHPRRHSWHAWNHPRRHSWHPWHHAVGHHTMGRHHAMRHHTMTRHHAMTRHHTIGHLRLVRHWVSPTTANCVTPAAPNVILLCPWWRCFSRHHCQGELVNGRRRLSSRRCARWRSGSMRRSSGRRPSLRFHSSWWRRCPGRRGAGWRTCRWGHDWWGHGWWGHERRCTRWRRTGCWRLRLPRLHKQLGTHGDILVWWQHYVGRWRKNSRACGNKRCRR